MFFSIFIWLVIFMVDLTLVALFYQSYKNAKHTNREMNRLLNKSTLIATITIVVSSMFTVQLIWLWFKRDMTTNFWITHALFIGLSICAFIIEVFYKWIDLKIQQIRKH